MTKEEAIEKLADIIFYVSKMGYIPYDTDDEFCAVNIAKKRIGELLPSTPSNIDEAAEKYANKEYPDEASCGQWGTGDYEPPVDMEYPREVAKDSFKAGAEWMTGQGYTTEEKIDRTPLNGPAGICLNLHEYDGFKLGDRVIVQIRKKD